MPRQRECLTAGKDRQILKAKWWRICDCIKSRQKRYRQKFTIQMRQHFGRRERQARKRRNEKGKRPYARSDRFGMVTLKVGRKKSSEAYRASDTIQLKKKFPGCVVDAE